MLKVDYESEIRELEGTIKVLDNLGKNYGRNRNEIRRIEKVHIQHVNKLIDEEIIPNLPDNLKDLHPSEYANDTQVAALLALALTGKASKKLELKTAQLRRFFDPLKSIEQKLFIENKEWSDVEGDFVLLAPKLAYAKGKELLPDLFYSLLKNCLKRVNSKEDMKSLIQFLEAIVAYHKYYGGKEK